MRENLRQLFLDFIDIGEDEEVWQRHLETYDALLAEVKRLMIENLRQQKRNEWLEEVVAQAQDHYHIDLSDEGWPRWREEE